MGNKLNQLALRKIVEEIELPDSAYANAEKRYSDIGEWIQREDSICANFDPSIYCQGSFRLGTAIRPKHNENYDLDIGCVLRRGVSKSSITQMGLKELIGSELKLYRVARQIKDDVTEKRRCWRLDYQDSMCFHIDVVPSIPESNESRTTLRDRMVEVTQLDRALAVNVSARALAITDNTDPGYQKLNQYWRISNPEGYALWFESRMRQANQFLKDRAFIENASIEELPYFKWRTPLQTVIQLLKRHRNTRFDPQDESQPISVIITTLAAKAYRGESDLGDALFSILYSMDQYINKTVPHVPNPVNPAEDFADKWYSLEHSHLQLKETFNLWLVQAKADFEAICKGTDIGVIIDSANNGLGVRLESESLTISTGNESQPAVKPREISPHSPKPWFAR